MNNTKKIIDNHKKRILDSSEHIEDTADDANTRSPYISASKICKLCLKEKISYHLPT